MSGWNIWEGGTTNAIVPRALATTEKLLGKCVSINDKYSLAALDTTNKIRHIRTRMSTIRASWDEASTMWQLIATGIVGYAPLVGTPSPSALHL